MNNHEENLRSIFEVFLKNPRLLITLLMLYISIGTIYLGITKHEILPLISEYGVTALGVLIAFAAFILQFDEIRKRRESIDERVSSVDERRREMSKTAAFENILGEIKNAKETQQVDYDKIKKIISESELKKNEIRLEQYKSFANYFDAIRELLENKSSDADEKASILLDKGTAYSKFGIIFFIFAIVFWQILSYWTGFQEQYIYGIVSSSLLFVFIEFLSAWFLRQYRNYVDTSTYLIKIKSIFDRYMLSYLAIHDSEKDTSSLVNILSDDIKWPETYLMKNADIGFAKEAMEAMTYMAQTVKKEAKNKKAEEV